MDEAKAYIKTNYIEQKKVLPVIFTTIGVSIIILLGLSAVGLGLVAIPLFIIAVLLLAFGFIYTGEYWLYADRLEEKLTPKLRFMAFIKAHHNTYYWNQLESYLADADDLDGTERKYLKLYFKNQPREVAINEGLSATTRQQFKLFMEHFGSLLETGLQNQPATAPAIPATVIKRKSYYGSRASKVLAIGFMLITAAFVAIYFFPQMVGVKEFSPVNNWKLWAVLVPSVLYFSARAFGKR